MFEDQDPCLSLKRMLSKNCQFDVKTGVDLMNTPFFNKQTTDFMLESSYDHPIALTPIIRSAIFSRLQ